VLPAIAAGAISDQIAVAVVAGVLFLTAVALAQLDDLHDGHKPQAWHLLVALFGIGVLVSVGVTTLTILILVAALVPGCAAAWATRSTPSSARHRIDAELGFRSRPYEMTCPLEALVCITCD